MRKFKVLFLFIASGILFYNLYTLKISKSAIPKDLESIIVLAHADSESGYSKDCWSSIYYAECCSVLKCDDPCCYETDYAKAGNSAGTCTGDFFNPC